MWNNVKAALRMVCSMYRLLCTAVSIVDIIDLVPIFEG